MATDYLKRGTSGWSRLVGTRRSLAAVVLAAVVVRCVLLIATGEASPRIVDERHYHELATSLVEGRGFAWGSGVPTSIRPPLYPAFIAVLWGLWGEPSLLLVRVAQSALSVGLVVLTWMLGRRLFDDRVGVAAAAVLALYPPFLMANLTLLSEVLFMVLLTSAMLLAAGRERKVEPLRAGMAGMLFGLASLTRSVVWMFPPVLALLLVVVPGTTPLRRRALAAVLLLAGHVVVLAPWAIRNTRVQGVPVVVDTMAGFNLWMANSDATPADRMWAAVDQGGAEAFAEAFTVEYGTGPRTEGEKDRWGRSKAMAYMLANPAITVRRALIKIADLWGLDREFAAGVSRGYYTMPAALALTITVAMVISFPIVALLAAVGLTLVPWRPTVDHWAVLLLIAYTAAMHAVVFGHPRYRLPLMPFLVVYASAALLAPRQAWQPRVWRVATCALLAAGLAGIWARELFVRDVHRVLAWFGTLAL